MTIADQQPVPGGSGAGSTGFLTSKSMAESSRYEHDIRAAQELIKQLKAALEAAQGERNALIAEFGQFKNEQREFRSLAYIERDHLKELLDGAKLANELIHGEHLRISTDLAQARARIVELEQRVAARPVCAKCRGSGRFEYRRDSWGDCPACDGRGH